MHHQINTPDEVHVSLKFSGFDFKPDKITNLLNIDPTVVRSKGEPWRLQSGGMSPVASDYNAWLYQSKSYTPPSTETDELSAHVHYVLDLLSSKTRELKEIAATSEYALFTLVTTNYHFNFQTVLEPQLVEQIMETGLSLSFDLYSLNGTTQYLETKEAKQEFLSRLLRVANVRDISHKKAALSKIIDRLASIEIPAMQYDTDIFNFLEPIAEYLTDEDFADRYDDILATLLTMQGAIEVISNKK